MDTKQVQINTFTDGLNTDLHPLTTPNTMLTDCINGTIITYNGNEYILQNDMGNYKLKKAILPADYIPVGVKEYGNIIYIVSYNPIDKKCQIGSYPSPQTLFDNADYGSRDENYQGVPVYILNPKWYWPEDSDNVSDGIINPGNPNIISGENSAGDILDKLVLFTATKPNQNIKVFFPQGTDLKETFLNPGDKYYLEKSEESSTWKFQRCEYYSLTESKEAYKLEDGVVIPETGSYTPEKLKNVTWEIPGWLAYKPSLIEPTSFDLYLTDIKIPSFLVNKNAKQLRDSSELTEAELSFDVQGQLTINTNDAWNDYYKNVRVYFDYKYANKGWSNDFEKSTGDETINNNWISSEEGDNPTNYGNLVDILTFNNHKTLHISEDDVKENRALIIRATPYIIDENNNGIVYDNLAVTYTINLGDLYQISSIKCFDVYKYLSDDEGITINFNIVSPTSNLSQITCKYRIHEIASEFGGISRSTDYRDIDSLNLLGQNILPLTYESRTDSNALFFKEEVYIFELAFFNIDDWNTYLEELNSYEEDPINLTKPTINALHRAAEFLITSKLLNTFYSSESRFQDIPLTEWSSRIRNNVSIDKDIEGNIIDTDKRVYNKYVSSSNPNDILKVSFYKDTNNNFITENNYPENNFIDDINVSETTAVDEIMNHSKFSDNIYYGCISSNIRNIEYKVPVPLILDTNEGMWSNVTWKSTVSSSLRATQNSEQNTIYNSANATPYTLKTHLDDGEKNDTDKSINIVYSKSNLASYISDKEKGVEGDKWYLYKNLFINFYSGDWEVNKILYNLTISEVNRSWTNTQLERLSKNMLLNQKNTRIAYRVNTWSGGGGHENSLAGLIDTDKEDNFDFNTLNVDKIDKKNNQGREDDGGRLMSLVDNYVTNNDHPWVFIPVSPVTVVTNKVRRGWNFGDGDINCSIGEGYNCCGIGIMCKESDTSKSVAVVSFFGPEYGDFEGRFVGEFWIPSMGNYGSTTSKWLVSSINKMEDVILGTSEKSQYMHQCVGALLFGLGIQLYGMYNTHIEYKDFLKPTGLTIEVSSENTFTINYKRTDILDSVYYKNLDIKSGLQDKVDNLFTSIGVNNKFYSTNNLRGDFSNITISSKTDDYTYIDRDSLYDYSIKFTSFIDKLNNELTTKLNNWTRTNDYAPNKVYYDIHSDIDISFISEICNMLIFEYKNSVGRFYYNGIPGTAWRYKKDGEVRGGFVRGINWEDVIKWQHVSNLLVPTQEFKERELEEKISNEQNKINS